MLYIDRDIKCEYIHTHMCMCILYILCVYIYIYYICKTKLKFRTENTLTWNENITGQGNTYWDMQRKWTFCELEDRLLEMI